MIAALYTERGGVYSGLPDVDAWDEARDARLYAGPWPVVAHPPCARWCRLAGLVEARWGHKRGDDGGCFAADRRCGVGARRRVDPHVGGRAGLALGARMIALTSLTPDLVADEVWGWVVGHVSTLLQHAPIPADTLSLAECHVRHSVACLTAYAQTGAALDAHPADYVQSVAEILWTAAHPDVYTHTDTIGDARGEPEHAIDVVIRAALARDALSGPGSVPLAWLAALASVQVATLRTYASRGELRVEGGQVRCSDARRWLGARGVAGIATTSPAANQP